MPSGVGVFSNNFSGRLALRYNLSGPGVGLGLGEGLGCLVAVASGCEVGEVNSVSETCEETFWHAESKRLQARINRTIFVIK
jgi:hypothetical protein